MKTKILIQIFFTIFNIKLAAQTVDFNYSTANSLYCAPQALTFTQNCSPAPSSYIWNFGNGQTGTNPIENITYGNPGTYTVKLTAVYPTRAVTITKTILINPTPVINLTADKNYLCQPGNVTFTAQGSALITSYEWNFGDGSPLVTTGNNSISHNYATYNSFTASVKVTTANGCTKTSTLSLNVTKFPISGSVVPSDGCIPSNSLFSVTTNLPAGDAAQNFLWDFGDGSSTMNTPTNSINHVFNITTTISTANVTVTTAQGCTNQFAFSVFAFGTPPFATDARTVSSRSTFCGSETIGFYGKAINATLYKWDFGDGITASVTDTLISHKYRSLGNKRVILTPYFNGCAGVKDTIDVAIEGVIADFTLNNTCSNKNTYSFINLSLGNVDHYEWIFSDTPSIIDSTNYNISHTFPSTGVFSSYLFLIDSITGCRDSLTRPVLTAQPVFTRSNTPVCKDSMITYRVLNSYPPGYGHIYEYHINGLVLDSGQNTNLIHYPSQRGDFIEYVVIKDTLLGTCNDTLYLPGTTRVRGPVADYSAPSRICADTALTITNTSYPFFAGEAITQWFWDFADNTTDTAQNPAPHSFPALAIYDIALTVTDINGCKNKTVQYIHITPIPGISVFPAVDTLCQGSIAVLTAFTTDSISWSPTTNIDCINCDTVHVNPPITTSYIAKAINGYGCRSSDTALVKVFTPINLVVYPADTTICPGQTIRYNTNMPGNTLWSPSTFLNNNKIRNPIAKPTTAITYTVTVKDSVGCFTDTAFAVVNMHLTPTVDAGTDQILPYYNTFTLNPAYGNDVVEYKWTPAADLSCSTCPSPSGVALITQDYKIEVKNINGCKASDTVRIFINCLNANLLMPNAFTPNNDGKNDYFYPITRGYRMVKTFIVYNRLGNKVFERSNFLPNIQSLGWDGRTKDSKNRDTEVFAWFMEAECDLGSMNTSIGTVILIR
jgi:gliding motility-associated-like protein